MTTKQSLKSLVNRATATLVAKTEQNNPAIQALAACIAAVSYGNYTYQDQLFRELHPETCSEPWLYLHASRHECPRILPTFSKGLVKFVQLANAVTIPQATRITFGELTFETIAEQKSNQDIDVIALQIGEESNLPHGTILKLEKALSGVCPNTITSLGFGSGASLEKLDHWRQRVILAFRKSQRVGKAEDYEEWAKAAHSDVDYAWVLDNTPALGMLEVYVGTKKDSPNVTVQVIEIVQKMLNDKRLAGFHPIAKMPEIVPLNLIIQGITNNDIRASALVEIKKFIIVKMGQYNRETNSLASITPTELILCINKITSQFILKYPFDEQFIATNQIFVLGDISWI